MAPTRSKRRTEKTRPFVVVGSGLLVIGLLLLGGFLVVRTPSQGVPVLDYTTVYASVEDPGNLQPLNDVRIGGVRVGQVVSIETKDERGYLKLRLDPGAEDVPRDSTVVVRGAGLLGQRYVEVVRGEEATTLADGGELRGARRGITDGIPDLLNTFDKPTRTGLRDSITGLGTGVLRRGEDLNGALAAAPPAGTDFESLSNEILARPGSARRLVGALESTLRELDASREQLVHGFDIGTDTLQPFVDRRAPFAQTFDELPPTLATARPALRGGRELLGAVRVLADGTTATLPAAPPALREAAALLRESHRPLGRATSLLEAAGPAVPAIVDITDRLSPLLNPLDRLMRDATPIVDDVARHGCDLDELAENWRSIFRLNNRGAPGQNAPLPSGMIGPLNSLRVTVVANATALQGVGGTEQLAPGTFKDPYATPCKYNNKTYLQTPTLGGTR